MSDLRYPTASPAMVKDIMNQTLVLSLDDHNDTVTIIVGLAKEKLRITFAVKVLGLHSEFFRVKTKFDSFLNHEDHQNQTIDLSEQNVDAMNAFFAWNTTRDIYSAKCLSKNMILSGEEVTTEHLDGYRVLWDQLLECYFLADFLGAPKFGNAIIDTLFNAIDDERGDREKLEIVLSEKIVLSQPLPITLFDNNENDIHDAHLDNGDEDEDRDDEETIRARIRLRDPFGLNRPQTDIRQMLGTLPYQIQRMYSNTTERSLVRNLLVDRIIVQGMSCEHYRNLDSIMGEGVPPEFHRSLVNGLMRTATYDEDYGIRVDQRTREKCVYHIHREGESCS